MALRVALDTNRYTDLARGKPEVLVVARRAEEIVLSFVVLGELRAGFLLGARSDANEGNLQRFLAQDRVSVAYPDEDTTHHYARLFAQLRRQGTPIPTNDLWIAAVVLQRGLFLCSRDAHFDLLPQLPRV